MSTNTTAGGRRGPRRLLTRTALALALATLASCSKDEPAPAPPEKRASKAPALHRQASASEQAANPVPQPAGEVARFLIEVQLGGGLPRKPVRVRRQRHH